MAATSPTVGSASSSRLGPMWAKPTMPASPVGHERARSRPLGRREAARPLLAPLLRVEPVEVLLWNQPVIGDLPRSDVDPGDGRSVLDPGASHSHINHCAAPSD